MKYFFIAVNYNGSDFTEAYVESINKLNSSSKDKISIIIIDNDSNKEDKEKLSSLEERYNNLKVLFSSVNLGYFKALNKGIETLKKDKDSIIIVGNNDLTFNNYFLNNLGKINYTKNVLVIAPNIVTKDGRQQNPHVVKEVSKVEKLKAAIYNSNYYIGQSLRLVNKVIKKINKHSVPLKNDYGQMKIKRGIGACYVLTPYFFDHYSKLDDRVFMWGEEALLSNQIEKVNGITLYDPTIKIIHHESASVSNIQSKKKYHMVKESYKIYHKYL